MRKHFNIVIIVIYAPIAQKTEEEIDNFDITVDKAKAECVSVEMTIMLGEKNVKTTIPTR